MTNMKKRIIALIVAVVVIALAVGGVLFFRTSRAETMTPDEAQTLINQTFDGMITEISRDSVKYVFEQATLKVGEMSYGRKQDITVSCTIDTIDAKSVIDAHLGDLMTIQTVDATGRQMVSTKLKSTVDKQLLPLLKDAKPVHTEIEVTILQSGKEMMVYTPDELVDAYTGGFISASKEITTVETVTLSTGEEITPTTNLRNAVKECLMPVYSTTKPATGNAVMRAYERFTQRFKLNFIDKSRYTYLTRGFLVTLEITLFAVLIGIFLGFLIAVVRSSYDKTKDIPPRSYVSRFFLGLANAVCKIYLTVIRGTPVVVQLMIIYYVIFASSDVNKVIVAVLAFGLNSAAYVAEIVRSGIMSIDVGQMEAGRSLGMSYPQTMISVVLPQAFKNILPALANEFIVLLKETSVSGYIALQDLTKGGDIIRSRTYDAFMPLIAVAVVYLAAVMLLSWLIGKLERRLRKSDRS